MPSHVATLYPDRLHAQQAAALKPWVPVGRRLVLVDIENLVGGSCSTTTDVANAFGRLRVAIAPSHHDVWAVACGPSLLAAATSAFPTRVLLGRGKDGADHQLLACLAPHDVVGCYASIALVSGDAAAFAEPVQELAVRGVPTDVYIGAGHIGAALYLAARSVTSTRAEAFGAAA
ncbi:unannotated protein [freshwater metagenome]|uniref:Unannotated protein n=1 Tax=freshwater metagenome TaxID=449393 RepID=A0A6J7F1B7_9ZZZZ|nr:hypothetical protein [Actinomycetota bacterium]